MIDVDLLACPSCREPLAGYGTTLRCDRGHSFDVAKQGYVNLLNGPEPANADTASMLAARARVLASGLFDPVAEAVAALASAERVLEVGAGTGFYLAAALGSNPDATGLALDVSKSAAKIAARADHRIGAVVADVWRGLPVRDACLDAVLCVFAPRNLAEFARVLAPSGRLVVVTPNTGHLAGLRDRYGLLQVGEDKAARLAETAEQWFALEQAEVVAYQQNLSAELAADLIAMGPNAFHRVPEQVVAAAVSVEVTVQRFIRLR